MFCEKDSGERVIRNAKISLIFVLAVNLNYQIVMLVHRTINV